MRYLFLLMIFLLQDAYGQSWYIKRNIKWAIPESNLQDAGVDEIIHFSFAEFSGTENELPLFTDVIEWHTDYQEVTIRLFSAKYEKLPEKFISAGHFSSLTGEIGISSHIATARKKPYLAVSMIPFRKNPLTGNVERLTEFVLEIESENVYPPIKQEKKSSAVLNSVLAAGEWYKIRVPSTGIYKITFDQLKSMGMTNPSSLRIFGNGGRMLPEDIRKGTKDDLSPLGFYMNKGSDGVFNQGDYILFYGAGVESWSFDFSAGMYKCKKNHYSEYGYYFLTCNNGDPDIMPDSPPPDLPVTSFVNQYDYYLHHESNEVNLIKSGKEFYGETFLDNILQRDFNFQVPGLNTDAPVKITTNVLSRSSDSAFFVLSAGNVNIETFRIRPANVANYTSVYAYSQQKTSTFFSANENLNLRLKYNRSESKAMGWLDFITVFARAQLSFVTDYITFRDHSSVAANAVTQFNIGHKGGNIIIWEVTDPGHIINIPFQTGENEIIFITETPTVKEFVAFRTNGSYPSPDINGEGLGRIENQNLHGITIPEMLIVSHEDFLDQAERLAQHRIAISGMDVFVTTPGEIYNEFSSGTPDVTAIRNFVKNIYDRGMNTGGKELKYLLLFGGGSYYNKDVDKFPGSYIPTYQSDNSLSPVLSYVSDDFFALLDPGEQMFDGMLDIGVGRIPVITKEQAENAVNKIIEYEHPSSMGVWRNSLCFIGDDEDNNIHLNQANQLADYVINNYPSFNVNKIFLDAYKKVSTPTGQRYPDVKKAFNEQVSRGALIINYTGHGGTEGLAHEQILEISDILAWSNKGKYPLFMTATCEFTRFDDPSKVSAGEHAFLNPEGGGIALFTTTRLVYSGPNHVLNERFYEIVFKEDQEGNKYRLGDIMKLSKNKTGSGVNKRNFSLIGDPSMCLAYPGLKVITDSINSVHISEPSDTLKALNKITVTGHIQDNFGNIMHSMDGILFPIVYDKPAQLTTLANDGGEKKSFTIQNSILYKGKASINNGFFRFSFIVPKDINYAIGKGKLSYYGHDSLYDATGAFMDIYIGGSSGNFQSDNTGPEINVFMNNENFRSGDITGPNPVLFVKISDESGINTAGNGIGHDITAILNNNTSTPLILNEYYEANLDSYKGGIVEYQINDLPEGQHTVNVKVWDIYNNSGEGFVEFIVAKSEDFLLNEIFNYPNPFSDITWFSFGHNRAEMDLEISIEIFNMNGDLLKTIKTKEYNAGFRSEPIEWNGKSNGGMNINHGIYVYTIRVKSSDGHTASKSGKLLIVR